MWEDKASEWKKIPEVTSPHDNPTTKDQEATGVRKTLIHTHDPSAAPLISPASQHWHTEPLPHSVIKPQQWLPLKTGLMQTAY